MGKNFRPGTDGRVDPYVLRRAQSETQTRKGITIDCKRDARRTFDASVPNAEIWAAAPNKTDIRGIDTKNPMSDQEILLRTCSVFYKTKNKPVFTMNEFTMFYSMDVHLMAHSVAKELLKDAVDAGIIIHGGGEYYRFADKAMESMSGLSVEAPLISEPVKKKTKVEDELVRDEYGDIDPAFINGPSDAWTLETFELANAAKKKGETKKMKKGKGNLFSRIFGKKTHDSNGTHITFGPLKLPNGKIVKAKITSKNEALEEEDFGVCPSCGSRNCHVVSEGDYDYNDKDMSILNTVIYQCMECGKAFKEQRYYATSTIVQYVTHEPIDPETGEYDENGEEETIEFVADMSEERFLRWQREHPEEGKLDLLTGEYVTPGFAEALGTPAPPVREMEAAKGTIDIFEDSDETPAKGSIDIFGDSDETPAKGSIDIFGNSNKPDLIDFGKKPKKRTLFGKR